MRLGSARPAVRSRTAAGLLGGAERAWAGSAAKRATQALFCHRWHFEIENRGAAMSMELVMNNDDLTWKIFSRLTELRDILRAEEVSREWHALMQNDRVWEPLCRRYAGKGLATGFGMLASLKARPECRLSWRQLFVQRALRSVNLVQFRWRIESGSFKPCVIVRLVSLSSSLSRRLRRRG